MATGYYSGPAEVSANELCVTDRQITLEERLDSEEASLKARLKEVGRLKTLLANNPDVSEILKLLGRRY